MQAVAHNRNGGVRPRTIARLIAEFLARRGVRRVYGLCGGHIQPIWDEAARLGIEVISVRHECAAVYMAQAQADLTGSPGVAMVTAGPGLTNAATGIANASVSRSPVLVISGRPPRPQSGMGALQDIPQADMLHPICRRVETVSEGHHVLPRLEAAVRSAEGNYGVPPGPAYIDFPTDLLRETIPDASVDESFFEPRAPEVLMSSEDAVSKAAAMIRESERPLVISGRGAREGADELAAFLESTGALYLDTAESRGVIPLDHPAAVPAARGKVMPEADLVITVSRKLDFQLAYGSRAVFREDAKLVRLGTSDDELSDNRRADAEVRGNVSATLRALLDSGAVPEQPDVDWLESMRTYNREKTEKFVANMDQPPGSDGRMHPLTILSAVNELVDEDTIAVADGGDILSFARAALRAETYLDPGALGCLGVGVPFAVSAALNFPNRRVISVIGDGSFGFTAMELDTAVRNGAKAVFVVANNEAWAIERHDQLAGYDGNLVGVDLPGCRYDRVAEGLGAYAERVEKQEDLAGALERALENAPALLDVAVTKDAESPDFKNGLAGVPDTQALEVWDRAEKSRRESGA